MGEAGETRLGVGVFWLLFSAVAFAVSILLQKPLVQRYGSLATTAWGFFFGTLALLWLAPSKWTQVGAPSGPGPAAVLQLALGPGLVAFVCWGVSVGRPPLHVVSTSFCLTPPLTLPIAWVWLAEIPTALSAICTVIVLAGLLIVHVKASASH